VAKGPFLQSLIPYLDNAAHPFALKIVFLNQTRKAPQNGVNPFIVLNDKEPLVRLFMGKVVTSTGNTVKDLFLLAQRDSYLLSEDMSSSLTNSRVETLWQEACRLLNTRNREPITFFANPMDDGTLVPFRSLFYCWFKELFFHPPCPACGGLLDLCTADDVLQAQGLPPYSSTLDRYLYCPSCTEGGTPISFFAPGKGNGGSPAFSGLDDLIRRFSELMGHADAAFPCPSCPEKVLCYDPEGKAAERIVPFSFFPFHLLAFDSYPVQAIDLVKPDSLVQTQIPMEAAPQQDQSALMTEVVETEVEEAKEEEAKVEEVRVEEAKVEEAGEDKRALLGILSTIRHKWEAELPKPEKKPKVQEIKEAPETDIKKLPVDMLEKTMIFSPGTMGMSPGYEDKPEKQPAPAEPAPVEPPPAPPPREVQLEKTMIFSPEEMEQVSSPGTKKAGGDVTPDQLEKTMLAGSDTKGHEEEKPAEEKKKTEEIPETIIMSLDELEGKKHDK